MVSPADKIRADAVPIAKTLGMKLVSFGDGRASFTMEVDERFHNPMGTLHGGIMTDLADATMGVALASLLSDGESFTTLELKINFLRPIVKGELRSEGKVVHKGRTVAVTEAALTNREGKEVARAVATQMILKV